MRVVPSCPSAGAPRGGGGGPVPRVSWRDGGPASGWWVVRGRRARTRGGDPWSAVSRPSAPWGMRSAGAAVAVPGAPAPPGRATPSGEDRARPSPRSGDAPTPVRSASRPGGEVAHPYNTPAPHWLSSLAGPGERWRMLAWHLPEPLASNQPRNLGASREQGTQHPTRRSVRPDRMVEGRAGAAGQPPGCRDGPAAAVHRHVEGTALDRAGGGPPRSGATSAGNRVHGAARPCRHH